MRWRPLLLNVIRRSRRRRKSQEDHEEEEKEEEEEEEEGMQWRQFFCYLSLWPTTNAAIASPNRCIGIKTPPTPPYLLHPLPRVAPHPAMDDDMFGCFAAPAPPSSAPPPKRVKPDALPAAPVPPSSPPDDAKPSLPPLSHIDGSVCLAADSITTRSFSPPINAPPSHPPPSPSPL